MNAYCQVVSAQVVEVWPCMDQSTTKMTAIDDTIDKVGAI
jgi:hypothetical protein